MTRQSIQLSKEFTTSRVDEFIDDYTQFSNVLLLCNRNPEPRETYLKRQLMPLFYKAWLAQLFEI